MRYTIENDVLRATVDATGAQLCSAIRKDDGVEHIWGGDPSVWGFHAPILFPHCGALPDDSFFARGRIYRSSRHGFARDMEHSLIDHGERSISFALESSDATRERFPYDFRLVSTFSLENETLIHRSSVKNTDSEKMPFGIGYHPAFKIPFDDEHEARDYTLRFSDLESPICLKMSPRGLISGEIYQLASNVREIAVDDQLFDDESRCMINLRSRTLGLYEKKSTRAVVCDISDFPYTLIWSKPGAPKFICIEPWHSLPSAEGAPIAWDDKPAAAIIEPGEVWTCELRTSFLR